MKLDLFRPSLRAGISASKNFCFSIKALFAKLSTKSIPTQHPIFLLIQHQIIWLSDRLVEVLEEEATVVAVALAEAVVEAEVRAVAQEVSFFRGSKLSELSVLHEQESELQVSSTLHTEHFSDGYALVIFDLSSLYIHPHNHFWSFEP